MKRLLLLTLMIVFISGDALAWGVRYPCARWITDDDRRPIERPSSEEAFSAPRAIPLESARSVQMLFELSARMTEIPSSFMPGNIIDAQNVNDFDEAPDSTWFTNRIGRREMTDRELKAGPGKPSLECGEKLEVLALGRTLSFAWLAAEDRRGRTFLMTFDSPKFPERSTGAGMIVSRVLHAAGYNVAPTGLFRVNPHSFSLSDGALFRDKDGNTRPAVASDLSAIF
nr:hypothetical protein [bacterium]